MATITITVPIKHLELKWSSMHTIERNIYIQSGVVCNTLGTMQMQMQCSAVLMSDSLERLCSELIQILLHVFIFIQLTNTRSATTRQELVRRIYMGEYFDECNQSTINNQSIAQSLKSYI